MSEWVRVYKCRLCGKEYSGNYKFMYKAQHTCTLDEWVNRGTYDYDVHKCSAQKRGIADCIGVKVYRKQEKERDDEKHNTSRS